MKTSTAVIAAAAAAGIAVLVPAGASAAPQRCVSAKPTPDFYAAGRISTTPVTDTNRRCTTIAVSGIRDAADPSDTCQTFLVALTNPGADPTYTEPVPACAGGRTVLATGIPAGTEFRVIYQVDYIDPAPQVVRFNVWY
ncbi:hypothetical protein [Actinoplanes derwentensis]|uniref:DUF4352 domain-containing protein n=1 Tax=Actinoplanes derwentensis TaxID=113562 RepID=A0A1H1YHR2_9ACTN|nr:hypothetical protein [Actinoplanes derwentensis]GID81148.1 hypothetical protein Ade03nite_00720 [Actinoplanes derwentensis]SDT20924.1 hypothetical protein SAMN04489716_2857 [Actinoplanes derwentensis]